jgi:hypothetical protein
MARAKEVFVVSRWGSTRTTLTAGIKEYRQRVPSLTAGKAGFGFHGSSSIRHDIATHPNLAPQINFGILPRKRNISRRDTAKV